MADLHSKILDVHHCELYKLNFQVQEPPGGPNSFNFMQFLGKFGKIVCWRPPWGVDAPPRGNPRSATGFYSLFEELFEMSFVKSRGSFQSCAESSCLLM